MNFFKSLVAVFNPKQDIYSGDLFSQRSIEIFLNAREHLTYYNSLRGVDAERNFHLELEAAIRPLIDLLDKPDSILLIDSIVFKNVIKKKGNVDSNVSAFLKRVDSEGYKLMGLTSDVTFESLKKSYKEAAKKHHPDIGGDENKMKTINAAYIKFQDILCTGDTKRFSDEVNFSSSWEAAEREIQSATDVIYLSLSALAQSFVDVWAVDEAVLILKRLESLGDLNKYQDLSIIDSYNLAQSLLKGADRLHSIGLTDSAIWMLDMFEVIFRTANKADPFIVDQRKRSRSQLKQKSELKIIIRHPLQAENLYRLKAIDEKRYGAYKKKSASVSEKDVKQSEQAAELIRNGFIKLKFENKYSVVPKTRPLIAVPSYQQARLNHLSDEQRAEYFYAFSPQGNLELLEKYISIRLNSYLMSVIFFYDKDEVIEIKRELIVLNEIGLAHNFYTNDLQKIIRHFEELSDSERTKKLRYCQRVDDPSLGATRSMSVVISISITEQPETHPIDFSSFYLSFLERTNSDGSRKEKSSSRWNEDLAALRKIDEGPLCKAAREACWEGGTPEAVIETVSVYIDALLGLSEKMDPLNTGQLQLGYWVDKLTTAYGKQKNWVEVKEWIEWFFALDNAYFERLSNGDRDKMQKRLERSQKELKKNQVTK